MATIMHGRREGQSRGSNKVISIIPEGVDPRKVTVLQPEHFNRIQASISHYNPHAEKLKAEKALKDELYKRSKEEVKTWPNTIEGVRQKRLQAKQLRDDKDEEERQKIDIEEAKHQAEKRKAAIERAKTLQYYQTDRVKTFHSALQLTEVLKERDAQIAMKKGQQDSEKIRDEHLLKLHKRQLEEGIREDQLKALKRYNERQAVSDFQLLQIKDHIEESKKLKDQDKVEGQAIKQQVEMYEAAKAAIEEQRRRDKQDLMQNHVTSIKLKEERKKIEEKQEELEGDEIRHFAAAKKKMAKMRKAKEEELFQEFQDHTERMRLKLWGQMKQKVDDEDDRIAKAVAEREAKREAEEKEKYLADVKAKEAINKHRVSMLNQAQLTAEEEQKRDKLILAARKESDQLYHAKQAEIKIEKLQEAKKLQKHHATKITDNQEQIKSEREQELILSKLNKELLKQEEQQFQEYADGVIKDAKDRGRNVYPLVKAKEAGPGGGKGPRYDGLGGLKPSYLVCDATGVQLPSYGSESSMQRNKVLGNPGQSRKRLGFTW